ncbi:PQQ-binding-like beta-propeller repeat protein [Gordonia phthalatica]|uniref:Pyrrolo-quinoline quinone repeat domain-containing protein n=1 Tax=Gordonia phthalatica TaxID=1136941 RepID=A0A0N9NJ60_9ACTN|nr:PQQ-binding-like beta-propeller repeat protein [Gordonia phthalatica]ALG85970.1 hypothetical protein ACH46_17575 [Gordonia phthalatica]
MTEPDPIRDRTGDVVAMVVTAVSVGTVVAALVISVMSLLSGGPDLSPEVDQYRVSVFLGFGILAAAALVVAAIVLLRRDRVSRRTPAVVLTGIWFLSSVVAVANRVDGAETIDYLIHRADIVGFLLFLAVPATALCLDNAIQSRRPPLRGSRIVAIGLVVAVVATALTTAPRAPESESTALVVTKLDVHPVATSPTPTSISTQSQAVEIEPNPHPDARRSMRNARPVGPGFLVATGELINADTGTVRWRTNLPAGEVSMLADQRNGLVIVSDPDRDAPWTAAIDADTGDIRWTSDLPLAGWVDWAAFDSPTVFLDGGFPVSVTDDLRTVRAFRPKDGSVLWTYTVPRDCAVDQIRDRPRLTLVTACTGGEAGRVLALDPTTGAVLSSRRSHGRPDLALQPQTAELPDRFVPVTATGTDWRLDGIRDTTTGRLVLDLRDSRSAGSSVESCAANGECVVRDWSTRRPDRLRIVSLTGAHPDLPVRGVDRSPVEVVWLRDQIVWTQDRSDDGTLPDALVIVDRRTGAAQIVTGAGGVPLIGPVGVTALSDDTLVRFEGKQS